MGQILGMEGVVEARGVGSSIVEMSCLVMLRTGLSGEPIYRTFSYTRLILNGWGWITG